MSLANVFHGWERPKILPRQQLLARALPNNTQLGLTYRNSQHQQGIDWQTWRLIARAVEFLNEQAEQWRNTCCKYIPKHVVEADIEQNNYTPWHGPILLAFISLELASYESWLVLTQGIAAIFSSFLQNNNNFLLAWYKLTKWAKASVEVLVV